MLGFMLNLLIFILEIIAVLLFVEYVWYDFFRQCYSFSKETFIT